MLSIVFRRVVPSNNRTWLTTRTFGRVSNSHVFIQEPWALIECDSPRCAGRADSSSSLTGFSLLLEVAAAAESFFYLFSIGIPGGNRNQSVNRSIGLTAMSAKIIIKFVCKLGNEGSKVSTVGQLVPATVRPPLENWSNTSRGHLKKKKNTWNTLNKK